MPRKCKFLLWASEDANKLPRSYLVLGMRLETDDKLRVCAKIFNDVNYPQVVYIPTQKKYKHMLCDKAFLLYVVHDKLYVKAIQQFQTLTQVFTLTEKGLVKIRKPSLDSCYLRLYHQYHSPKSSYSFFLVAKKKSALRTLSSSRTKTPGKKKLLIQRGDRC